jgi:hypothetical protein
MILHRPEMHEPGQHDGILEVIIAKQRNGPVGEITLRVPELPTPRPCRRRPCRYSGVTNLGQTRIGFRAAQGPPGRVAEGPDSLWAC